MSPACYTCKHCKRKGHLAKDCPELGEQEQDQHQQQQQQQGGNGGTFERESSSADRLLVEEEGEEDEARGINNIRMIFDEDDEEEGNSSKGHDEVTGEHNKPEDPRSESNADVQRYKSSASYQIYCYIQYWPYCDKCALNSTFLSGI